MTTMTGNTISFLQFVESREKDTFPLTYPIYLLEGNDEFLIREALHYLVEKLLKEGLREFNYSRLKGDKTFKASEVYSLCMELPVMSARRVVYLEDTGKISSEEREKLAKYIEGGLKETVLIMSGESSSSQRGKSQTGKKLDSLLKSRAACIQCQMTEREIEDWISASMKYLGFEIRQDAAHELRRRIGPDLWLIDLELKKIRAYCGSRRIVSRQDVETISTHSPHSQMYQLTENIARGDTNNALKIFHELTFQSEPTLGILNYINRFFLGILEVRMCWRQSGSIREVAKLLKKSEFVVRKNVDIASLIEEQQLQKIAELLVQADFGMKKGKEKRLIFETLIVHLCMLFKGNSQGRRQRE
jgi:DNA polymerase III subunit delta